MGGQLEYSKMMSSDYALSFSGGASFSRETLKPGDNALPGEPQLDYEQTSWNVRVGGERVVNVGERAAFYFGPGVEYWSGSAKFDDVFIAATVRSPTTKRVSLTGRIGGPGGRAASTPVAAWCSCSADRSSSSSRRRARSPRGAGPFPAPTASLQVMLEVTLSYRMRSAVSFCTRARNASRVIGSSCPTPLRRGEHMPDSASRGPTTSM